MIMNAGTRSKRVLLAVAAGIVLGGCVTQRIENIRETDTGIEEGEGIVIMAKSYHLGNETEANFIECVGDSVGRGRSGLRVIPNTEFVDALFPWFEPRTAPVETKGLPKLMSRARRPRQRSRGARRTLHRLAGRRHRQGGRRRKPVVCCRAGRRRLLRFRLVAE